MPPNQWDPPCSPYLESRWRYVCTHCVSPSHNTNLPPDPSMDTPLFLPLPSPQTRPEWHRNIEAAIQHYSVSKGRQPAISVVDSHGKFSVQLTYGKLEQSAGSNPHTSHLIPPHPPPLLPPPSEKLAAKALKIAHFLLHKLGGGKAIKPGDRVRQHRLHPCPPLPPLVTWCQLPPPTPSLTGCSDLQCQ